MDWIREWGIIVIQVVVFPFVVWGLNALHKLTSQNHKTFRELTGLRGNVHGMMEDMGNAKTDIALIKKALGNIERWTEPTKQ